ncbi:polymorphic toxin-type HINT domain-containing protein [Salinithrix halophila]|uniref:Polymorphic toxin-type HINT domain-containing protein n=1 Tax=Salinithrix halophila TaxID=1485204 RepID=A0ABV8JE88_9BACL
MQGKGWVKAKDLQKGDRLQAADGRQVRVDRVVQRNTKPIKVYNFEVEDYHTYFVSDAQVWVHNRCGGYIPNSPLKKQRVKKQDIPLPDPRAEGRPHTVLGGKMGSDGVYYRQSATFSGPSWPKANGYDVPISEVHWHNHSTPQFHSNPHQHVFRYNTEQKSWRRGDQESLYR